MSCVVRRVLFPTPPWPTPEWWRATGEGRASPWRQRELQASAPSGGWPLGRPLHRGPEVRTPSPPC
eukprot:5918328-Alexandrium_andersonii.AAC.1